MGDVTKLIFADISAEGILFIEGIVFSFTTIVHHDSQGDLASWGLTFYAWQDSGPALLSYLFLLGRSHRNKAFRMPELRQVTHWNI